MERGNAEQMELYIFILLFSLGYHVLLHSFLPSIILLYVRPTQEDSRKRKTLNFFYELNGYGCWILKFG